MLLRLLRTPKAGLEIRYMETPATNNLDIEKERVPPYIAYRTFMNFLNAMNQGLPSRIDRSVVGSLSGAAQGQLISALRYFALIRLDGQPNQSLRVLVAAEGLERQQLLKSMIAESYGFVFKGSIDLERATKGELTELFAGEQIKGETLRKAISFFLAICRAGSIRLSTQLAPVRRRRITGRRSRTIKQKVGGRQRPNRDNDAKPPHARLPKLPAFNSEWTDELKMRWFDLFEALIVRNPKECLGKRAPNPLM